MKKIKDLIKKNPEPAKGTNMNPGQLGQYSARYQVSEGSLEDYLSARGIDADHLSTPTKIAHSKSNAFLKWKRDHMKEDRTLTPSPTQQKLTKLNTSQNSHKEIKTARGPGSHHEAKGSQMTALTPEEVVYEDKKPKMTALDRFRKAADEREKKHKETEKNSGGMTSAIDRLQKHLNKEESELEKKAAKYDFTKTKSGKEVPKQKKPFRMGNEPIVKKEEVELDEMDQKFIDSLNKLSHRHKEGDRVTVNSKFFGKQKGKVVKVDNQSVHVQRDGKKFSEKYPHDAVMAEDFSPIENELHKKSQKNHDKELDKFVKGHKKGKLIPTEEGVGDPQASTQSPADGANGGNELSEKRRQMSKSARMIKALYKKKGVVKEDMYDHEKEDKSVATYGKKPKFDKADKDDSIGEKKPTAAATLTGGTTLTGEKRDDVEIDPMMRNRPGQPEVGKKDDKKDGKKEDKKKDK
jgi:hypothetical protein